MSPPSSPPDSGFAHRVPAFRDLLIRRKLTILMMVTSLVTLLLSFGAWFAHDVTDLRRQMVGDLSAMADYVARRAADDLAAGHADPEPALMESLQAFGAHGELICAHVFDTEGRVLAELSARTESSPEPPPFALSGHRFTDDGLLLYRPIRQHGEQVGSICVVAGDTAVRSRLRFMAQLMAVVFLGSLLVVFLISSRLQAVISGPVLQLTDTVRAVVRGGDYSLRARRHGRDELGFLTDAFNALLEQIQARDSELRQSRANLEAQVTSRTSELQELNQQLRLSMEEAEGATIAKSRFLANMSHEIRTPMNGVLGMTDLLLDTPLSAQQRSYADIVRSSADALLGIINDILDFSKIEAGKLGLEEIEFDLHRCVEDVVGLLSTKAHEKGVELVSWTSPSVPTTVEGDPTRLRQILTNLVGNAVKFTEQGRISIHVDLGDDSDEDVLVYFKVRDSGIGIPRSRKDRLFDSFSQVDSSTTRKYGGTGLGLSICKQLAELMGGAIGVESELGVGSTFWFTARFRRVLDGGRRRYTLPNSHGRRRILVADSSAAIRETIHLQLEAWEVEHDVVADAERAVQVLRRAREEGRGFDLLLVEDELLGDLGDAAEVASIPERVVMSWRAGGAGLEREGRVLAKPVRPSELFDALVAHLPEDETSEEPQEVERLSPLEAASVRILLAEDNAVNRLVAMKMLAKGGFTCDQVADGQRAVEVLRRTRYDVVLMDCQMPRLDGFEATREVRAWELARAVDGESVRPLQIIALTANAMQGDRERCLDAGMDDYVTKPVKPDELVQRIHDAVRRLEEGRLLGGDGPGDGPVDAPGASAAGLPRPPLDVEALAASFAGRREELVRAIEEFEEASDAVLAELRPCIEAEDVSGVEVLLDRLQESARVFEPEGLRLWGARLANMCGRGAYDAADRCLEELTYEQDRCRELLPRLLERFDAAG